MKTSIRSSSARRLLTGGIAALLVLGTASPVLARGYDSYRYHDYRPGSHHLDRHHHHRRPGRVHHYRYDYPRHVHSRHYRCHDCYRYPWGAYGLGVVTGYVLGEWD